MKRLFFISKLLILGLIFPIFFSCGNKNQNAEKVVENESSMPINTTETKNADVKNEKIEISMVDGVMIYENGALWTPDNEGVMIYATSISKGSTVKVYTNPADSKAEIKKCTRLNEGKKEDGIDFIHIQYNGNDYWARDFHIAVDAVPAIVIKNDAYIYTEASAAGATKDTLNIGDIVAKFNDAEEGSYSLINVRDSKSLKQGVYLKTKELSTNANDIESMKIYKKLKNTKNAIVKAEVLEEVQSLEISAQLKEMFAEIN